LIRFWFVLGILGTAFILTGCSGNNNVISNSGLYISDDSLVAMNREFLREENQAIDDFCSRYKLSMETTQTGLRYREVKAGQGAIVTTGSSVTIRYKVRLLSGDLIYQTPKNQSVTINVGKRKIPSGLDEGIQLMKVGSEYLFILPSHLAYGIVGDQDRIPERAVLVCDVELLATGPPLK
jgi:FKBP-type peptidyl-prolyl cis-trans isomerase